MAGNTILAVGSEAQAEYEEQLANNNGTNGNLSTAPEGSEEATTTEEDTITTTTETTETTEETTEETEETGEVDGYFFGDTPVEIEVPQEISEALKGAKIDEATLLKELFAKEGKFEVSEKTKAALDKAFGKQLVDGYLNLFRSQNQMAVDKFKSDSESLSKQVQANSEDFQTLVGGDEGWGDLDAWASENLSEAELTQFNAVMNLPVEHYAAQRAVVEALQLKRKAAVGEAEGDSIVRLPTDGASGSGKSKDALPTSLTREEFQALFNSERYRKEPAWANQVDAIRRSTQQREAAARRK